MSRKAFTEVPAPNVKRNLFDLSHEVKMSGKFGYLYPVMVQDMLPGDTVDLQMSIYARAAPLLAPILHRCDITAHAFFVANRTICDSWEDFITGGQDGDLEPVLPYITPAGIQIFSASPLMERRTLWDYMGLPVWDGVEPSAFSQEAISVLPFRAYQKIWNDFYRDPNLDDELDLRTDLEGNVSQWYSEVGVMRRRGWEKDYFTSALPWAQRGSQVLMPLAGTGDVTYKAQSLMYDSSGNPLGGGLAGTTAGGTGLQGDKITAAGAGAAARIENIDSVIIDESTVYINDLRRAMAIQKWLEANARGGARYVEQIRSHFDQVVPDYRLQRAEYLGGSRQPLQISEVLATAESENVPVGDLAGHGISVGKSRRIHYRCEEHGWCMVILSIMPRTAYSQGIDRMWSRTSKFDFAWPELAHIGEQPLLSKEIFFSFDQTNDDENQEVFGYMPRYSEYKFKNDRIAGDFRDTLQFWQLGRKFLSRPVLDSDFTTMDENGYNETQEETYRRIFAVQDGTDYFWMQVYHKFKIKRPLPYFGIPRIS